MVQEPHDPLKASHALGIFLVVSAVFFSAFLASGDYWGVRDWGFHNYMNAASREILLTFGQIPLWDPYRCGGNVLLAHPEAPIFGIPFLLFLILNSTLAFKLGLVIEAAIGMLGMWLLARHLGVRGWSSLLPPLIGILNSSIFLYSAEGNFWARAIVWFPFLIYFLLKCEESRFYAVPAALSVLLMLLGTNIYAFAVALFAIGAFALADSLLRRRLTYVKTAAIIVALIILLGAFKIFPLAHYALQFPEYRADGESGYSWSSLMTGLLDRDQGPYAPHRFPDNRSFYHHGAYIGWLPFLIGLLGLALYWRRQIRLSIVFLLTMFLAFGNNAFLNVYAIIKLTPPFSAFHEATRFLPLALVIFGVFAGLALSRFERVRISMGGKTMSDGLRTAIVLGIILIAAADMYFVNTAQMGKVFIAPPIDPGARAADFEQANMPYGPNPWPDGQLAPVRDMLYYNVWGHGMYINFLRGRGTPRGYCHGNVGMNATPRILENGSENEAYRGEVYLLSGNGTARASFSPERVTIDVGAEGPDLLILNQNYYDEWRVDGGTGALESYNGLLAVPVDAQTRSVTFYYSKKIFLIGLLVSAATAICLWLCWKKRDALGQKFSWFTI